MKRIFLFIITNLSVMLVLSVVVRLFGLDQMLAQQGGGLNLTSLLMFAAVFGFGGSIISLLMSKRTAKMATGARVITQPANQTEAWLVETVKRQAKAAKIGMPEVAIYDAPEMNAFATGASRNRSLVAVSSGLLQQMQPDEAEAVLAHEVSHIANGDMVTLTLIQGVVNTFVIFFARIVGNIIDKTVFRSENGHGPAFWITTIVAELVLGILASIIVMWFSRQREFRADAGGAALAGKQKMIAALQRLRQGTAQHSLPEQVAAFGISGGVAQGIKALFMTHPPLEQRIAVLQKTYK